MRFTSLLLCLPNIHCVLQRIWFIRHCDKPDNNDNPCCSNLGLQRAHVWPSYFKTHLPTHENAALIYTSGFSQDKQCTNNGYDNAFRKKNCPSSQRMWLTSNILYQNLQPQVKKIHHPFCVGDYKNMIKNILEHGKDKKKNGKGKNKLLDDIIVVWEHEEIVDMLRELDVKTNLGYNIPSWHNKDIFDIVFLVDIQTNTLYCDCYPFPITNQSYCKAAVSSWCQDVSLYYQTKQNMYLLYGTKKMTPEEKYIVRIIIDILIVFFVVVISCIFMYVCCCVPVAKQKTYRHSYINIDL